MRIESSDVIRVTPEHLFSIISDMSVFTRWNNSAERVSVSSPGPINVGSQMVISGKMGDMPFEVVELDPPRRLTVAADTSRMAVRHTYLLEPADGDTRLNQVLVFEPRGIFKLMTPLMAPMIRRGHRQTTDGLRVYAET